MPGTEQSGRAEGEAKEGQGRSRRAPVRDTGGLGGWRRDGAGFTWHEILTLLLWSTSSRREEADGSRDGQELLESLGPQAWGDMLWADQMAGHQGKA